MYPTRRSRTVDVQSGAFGPLYSVGDGFPGDVELCCGAFHVVGLLSECCGVESGVILRASCDGDCEPSVSEWVGEGIG